jgi:hypothetical protein
MPVAAIIAFLALATHSTNLVMPVPREGGGYWRPLSVQYCVPPQEGADADKIYC